MLLVGLALGQVCLYTILVLPGRVISIGPLRKFGTRIIASRAVRRIHLEPVCKLANDLTDFKGRMGGSNSVKVIALCEKDLGGSNEFGKYKLAMKAKNLLEAIKHCLAFVRSKGRVKGDFACEFSSRMESEGCTGRMDVNIVKLFEEVDISFLRVNKLLKDHGTARGLVWDLLRAVAGPSIGGGGRRDRAAAGDKVFGDGKDRVGVGLNLGH